MRLSEPAAAAGVTRRAEMAEMAVARLVTRRTEKAAPVVVAVAPVRLSVTREVVASIGIRAMPGRRADRTRAEAGSTSPERYPRCGGTVRRH
jgi:hypothetical protein